MGNNWSPSVHLHLYFSSNILRKMISKMFLLLGLCLVTLGSPIDEANLEDDLDEANLEIEDALNEYYLDLEDSDRQGLRLGLEDSDRGYKSFKERCQDCKTRGYGSLRWCSAKKDVCEKMLGDSDRGYKSFKERCEDCKTNGYGYLRWCSAKKDVCEKMLG